MRPIDADALKLDLSRFYYGEVTARELIDEQPTIEYRSVINAPNKYILYDIREYFIMCKKNAQPGSSADNRFSIYLDTINDAIEMICLSGTPPRFDKDNTVRRKPSPDDPFCRVIIAAVRYCLGRQTYMPDTVTRWIMASVPELPAEIAKILLRDINDQRRTGSLGDKCDVETWERFESWLQGRLCE